MNRKDKINALHHIFIQWIASKGVLEQWLDNIEADHNPVKKNGLYSESVSPETHINHSFTWSCTPEDPEFWRLLNAQWKEIHRKILYKLEL